MRLTPLNIRQQKFPKTWWGYDVPEVHAFLDVLAHDFDELEKQTNTLRDELSRREADLREFIERERTLKETMITATRITEDIKANARREAEVIVAHAEAKAEEIVHNAHQRLVRIIEEIDELRRQRTMFEASLRSTIAMHGRLLDTQPGPEAYFASLRSPSRSSTRASAEKANGASEATVVSLVDLTAPARPQES